MNVDIISSKSRVYFGKVSRLNFLETSKYTKRVNVDNFGEWIIVGSGHGPTCTWSELLSFSGSHHLIVLTIWLKADKSWSKISANFCRGMAAASDWQCARVGLTTRGQMYRPSSISDQSKPFFIYIYSRIYNWSKPFNKTHSFDATYLGLNLEYAVSFREYGLPFHLYGLSFRVWGLLLVDILKIIWMDSY